MTPNQWNRNTRDSVVRLLTQAGFSEDSSVINQLECMNFDAPAEPAKPQSDQDYIHLCAALYQACGAYDMPERVLDALSAAANAQPFIHLVDGILPCMPDQPQNTE